MSSLAPSCSKCGQPGMAWVTHVCPPVATTPSTVGRSAMSITLPLDVWSRIVFAAQESDDYRLRTLIEQAVYEAR